MGATRIQGTIAAIVGGLTLVAVLPVQASIDPAVPQQEAQQEARAPREKARPKIYDESADAPAQIAEALARAKKDNRRVLIQWGANWCGWCHLLHDCFQKTPEVRRELLYEYEVVLIDIGGWDKNLDLAERYRAEFKQHGVPYLTILDAEGKVVANQETGSLEKQIDGKPGHDPEAVMAFLTKHQAEHLSAESILAQALVDAKATNRKVLLHFGAPWCGWCRRLEAWMDQEQVAEILGKDFVLTKIDIDRTIGGPDVMARYRKDSDRGGIPWFVFLDIEGQSIVTSDGPEGNIGCPGTDEEIAAFGEILQRVVTAISASEINGLQESLVKTRDGWKPATSD